MKPTITKEQAEVIQKFMDGGEDRSGSDLLRLHAKDCWGKEYSCLNDLDLLTLAAALVNGYEVEATPEERVREYYEKTKRTRDERHSAGDRGGRQFHNGVLDGIVSTISILGIHIEGVNVH